MSQDIKIRGTVSVIVDPVDIEQAEIESPAILKEFHSIKAMIAARGKDSFISMRRVLESNKHILEYDSFQELPFGRVEVFFNVRAKTAEEITHND